MGKTQTCILCEIVYNSKKVKLDFYFRSRLIISIPVGSTYLLLR